MDELGLTVLKAELEADWKVLGEAAGTRPPKVGWGT